MDYASWCASVKSAPVPIDYSVVPNTYLIGTVVGDVRLAEKMNKYMIHDRPLAASSCVPGQKWNKKSGECDPSDCPQGYLKLEKPLKPPKVETLKLCEACPKGKFLSSSADAECKECSAGTFSQYPGASECEICELGKSSSEGSAACDLVKGSYAIQLGTNKAASLAKADRGKGDGDIPGGDNDARWGYWDKKSSQHKVQISPVPEKNNTYYVQSGSFYLDATKGGDKSKSGSKYWAFFGSDTAEVELVPSFGSNDKDKTKYVLKYKSYKITSNSNGDNDKQYGRSRRRKKYNGKSPWSSWKSSASGQVTLQKL